MPAPTAFISHTSSDKDRFVRAFAERLRADGIDAWYDEWELRPADSLVDRIFEEGLANADVFLIVLSVDALNSRWVREELNTAVVRRIEAGCKLVPLVLDGVEVPEAIKATVWQPISDVTSYDDEYERILAAIFDRQLAPAIGPGPAHADEQTLIDDLPRGAVAVLMAIGAHVLESEQEFIGSSQTFDGFRSSTGLSTDQFIKEITRLARADYIDVTIRGDSISHGELLLKGVVAHLHALGYDTDRAYDAVVAELVNTDHRTLAELAEATKQPPLVVDVVLQALEIQNLVSVARYMGGRGSTRVHRIDPLLEDELD